jgi:chemotaxis protein CheX
MTPEQKENFLKFSHPFIQAAKKTFSTMVQTKINFHSPRLKNGSFGSGTITALIGINGDFINATPVKQFEGVLALGFTEEIYTKLASRMLMQEYTQWCEDIADTGAELCNIILGQSKAELSKMGLKLALTTPTTIRGRDLDLRPPTGSVIIETKIMCDLGEFTMDICYQDFLTKN